MPPSPDSPLVTVTARPPGPAAAMLEGRFRVNLLEGAGLRTPADLRRAIHGSGAVLGMLSDPFTREVIESVPELKVIATYAVGYNNIDIACCRERGIRVCNTPDVLTEATAELAFALLLAVSRRIVEGDRFTREGRFTGWEPGLMLGVELAGKTCGVIGLGRIGAAFARRARASGMDVIYTNRSESPHAAAVQARRVPLEELLRTADVVSIHTPLNAESAGLLSRERLALLKADAILVNTARGQVVDEAALVELLRARRIFGAGLDVFEREPELSPGLVDLPNVVLAPHAGSATRETRAKMGELCAQAIIDVLEGREPRNAVV